MGKMAGSILFAGNKPTRPFLRRFTGYVEQFGELTVLFGQFRHGQHGCVCVFCVSLAWMQAQPLGSAPNAKLLAVPANCVPWCLVHADTLLPILTVEEMLLYTAELKRPRQIPLSEKQAAVEELLDKLALKPCR